MNDMDKWCQQNWYFLSKMQCWHAVIGIWHDNVYQTFWNLKAVQQT
jgi:hypothetical protein